ncbi:hypothetical protein DOABOMFO_00086 [Enterococcus phage EF_KTM]|nr:hypothetical protein P9209_30120 [Prescottella defluvii]WQZ01500.1 hypothetical protein DDLHHHOO_00011 [Enterococcus phage EF_RCK]WVH07349.1 hypothetical protein AIMFIBHH_00059 [Enterococcus phage EF_TR1]
MDFTITEEKLYNGLSNFDFWSGAVDSWQAIEEAGLIEEAEQMIFERLGEQIERTYLNDYVWFDLVDDLENEGHEVYTND